jgi:O-antigen/teichoic acid export membrane protein
MQPGSESTGLGRLLLRDSALYGAGHFAARSTYLILVPVLTRVLAPPEYGAVDLLTAASAIALSLVSLEVTQGLARYVSAEQDPAERRRLASSALWYGAAAFALLSLLGVVLADPLSTVILGSQGDPAMVGAAALAASANGIFLIVHSQLRWELRAGAYAAVAVIFAFTSLGATIAVVTVARAGVVGVFAGQLIGSALASAVAFRLVRGSFTPEFSSMALRRILRFSVPLVPAAVAAFVAANVDRFVISRMLENAQVGVYGVGYRIASIVGIAVVAFQLALTPLIYARYERASTPRELASVFDSYVVLAVTAWLTVSLFAPELVAFLATSPYSEANSVISFLAGALIVKGMASFAPGLAIAGRTEIVAVISTLTLAAVIALNLILVPVVGIEGAAAASLVSAFIGLAVTVVLGQRYYPVPYRWMPVTLLSLLAIGAVFLSSALALDGIPGVAVRLGLVVGIAGAARVLGLMPGFPSLRSLNAGSDP